MVSSPPRSLMFATFVLLFPCSDIRLLNSIALPIYEVIGRVVLPLWYLITCSPNMSAYQPDFVPRLVSYGSYSGQF